MLCGTISALHSEMQKLCPEILSKAEKCLKSSTKCQESECTAHQIKRPDFESIRQTLFNYAICAKSNNIAFAECNMGWKGVGSWKDFATLTPQDRSPKPNCWKYPPGNSKNYSVYADRGRSVAVLGLENIIAIGVGETFIIAKKDRYQEIGRAVPP